MKVKYFIIGFLVSFISILLIGFGLFKFSSSFQDEQLEEYVKQPLDTLNIQVVKINDFDIKKFTSLEKNKEEKVNEENIVIINFWATWCAPCVKELPEFQKLVNKLKDDNKVKFIFATQEKKEKINEFLSKNKELVLPYYSYKESDISKSFNHEFIPTTYIINPKTKIAFRIDDMQNWNSELIHNLIKSLR